MLNPFAQAQDAVPWTPVPVKRTAIRFGCLIVAEMAVTANCPETVFDLTTRHVDELDGDESAAAGTTSATATAPMAIPATRVASLRRIANSSPHVAGRPPRASLGGEAPRPCASALRGGAAGTGPG